MADDNVFVRGRQGGKANQARELKRSYDDGFEAGLQKGRQEILDWLQNAYINDPGRPDRNSPKGEAILEVARDAGAHFREKVQKRGRRR